MTPMAEESIIICGINYSYYSNLFPDNYAAGEKAFCYPFVSNPSFLLDERSGACCPRRHGRGIVPVHRADRYRGRLSTGGSSVSAGGNPVSFRWYG